MKEKLIWKCFNAIWNITKHLPLPCPDWSNTNSVPCETCLFVTWLYQPHFTMFCFILISLPICNGLEAATKVAFPVKNFYVNTRDGPWPDPTELTFGPAVNKRPTCLWPGYFLAWPEEIFLTRATKNWPTRPGLNFFDPDPSLLYREMVKVKYTLTSWLDKQIHY